VLKNQIKSKSKEESGNSLSTECTMDTTLSLKAVKNDDIKMKLFTGLTFPQFSILLQFLGDYQ